ncbi:unnamed protein product, partial [marine sediment metagenome]
KKKAISGQYGYFFCLSHSTKYINFVQSKIASSMSSIEN